MRILKIVIVIMCIILIVAISPWIISPIINDIRLYQRSHDLTSYSLPKNTELIEKESICGKLNGNGNGMDFLATILIRSDLNLEELQKYYSFATVIKQDGGTFSNECLEHGEIKYTKLKNIKDFDKYYVVFIYDGGHFELFDIRGG